MYRLFCQHMYRRYDRPTPPLEGCLRHHKFSHRDARFLVVQCFLCEERSQPTLLLSLYLEATPTLGHYCVAFETAVNIVLSSEAAKFIAAVAASARRRHCLGSGRGENRRGPETSFSAQVAGIFLEEALDRLTKNGRQICHISRQ